MSVSGGTCSKNICVNVRKSKAETNLEHICVAQGCFRNTELNYKLVALYVAGSIFIFVIYFRFSLMSLFTKDYWLF